MAKVLLYTTQGNGIVSAEVDKVSIDGAFEISGRVKIDPDAIVMVYPAQVDDRTLHIDVTDIYYGFRGVLIVTSGAPLHLETYRHINTPHELIKSLQAAIVEAGQ